MRVSHRHCVDFLPDVRLLGVPFFRHSRKVATTIYRTRGTPAASALQENDPRMPVIKLRDNEPFEVAMKRFKKQCEKACILSELKRREYYDKPIVRRKKKAAAARKRALKKQRRMAR